MDKEYIKNLIDSYEEQIEEYKDDLIFAINNGERNTINAKITLLTKVTKDLIQIL